MTDRDLVPAHAAHSIPTVYDGKRYTDTPLVSVVVDERGRPLFEVVHG